MANRKALEDVVVLDLNQPMLLAGPFATSLLADFGADVILIEPPKGGFYHQRNFTSGPPAENKRRNWGQLRNKKSISINLKSPKGKNIFLDLVKKADVVSQNFSVGTMERLGLGYETLKKVNPGIIYCATSGYGQTGPYSGRRAYDSIIQADSGLMSMTGFPDGPPVKAGPNIADYCAAVYGAIGILIALYHKKITGNGQMIDHGMFDALCHWTVNEIPLGKMTGMERFGNRYPLAILDAHETKDGQYLVFTAQSDDQWENLLRLIGRDEIITEKWDSFTRNVKRRDDVERWNSVWVKTKTLEEALQELDKIKIPATGVTTRTQLETHPQVLSRELLVEIEDPELGKLSGIRGVVPKLMGTPGEIDMNKPPAELGQHTEEILSSILGFNKEKIISLKEEGII
jgi:CoA:oxalate CoA-transferase